MLYQSYLLDLSKLKTLFMLYLGPPHVHPMPDVKAVVGRAVYVMCPASGYPLDKIIWSKGKLKEYPLISFYNTELDN